MYIVLTQGLNIEEQYDLGHQSIQHGSIEYSYAQ